MSYLDWPPRQNHPEPNGIDWFRRKLTSIGGEVVSGVPRFRLVWGQKTRERDRKPGSPNFDGGDMMRYRYSVITRQTGWLLHLSDGSKQIYPLNPEPDVPEGALLERLTRDDDIGIPRWHLERFRYHTARDRATYDQDRTWLDPESGQTYYFDSDEMGIGQYEPVNLTAPYWLTGALISKHDGNCCAIARLHHTKCFAYYRAPAQADLDLIAKAWQKRLKESMVFRPDEIIPNRVVEQQSRTRLGELKDRREQERAETRGLIKDIAKFSRARIFATGHGMDLFRYKFLGDKNKSADNPAAYSGPEKEN